MAVVHVVQEHNSNAYYVGWAGVLTLVLLVLRKTPILSAFTSSSSSSSSPSSSSSSSTSSHIVSAEFQRFQNRYFLVYLIMMGADWLQGPYVFALYKHYGFTMGEIGVLFIVGFGSSLLFGTVAGSMADKYGRKRLCIAFGIMYSLSCITKHFHDYNMLMIGRFLGGISTSILFSAFESWMVHEHHAAGYSEEWLGLTFSRCTFGNAIVAIVSGVVASLVRDQYGPVAPFDVSLVLLVVGTLIVAFTWAENTGDSHVDVATTMTHAVQRLRLDPKIAMLGIIQSFFEGAMYVFVFMWTPTLESTSAEPISHGWIFAAFMICVLIGSTLFEKGLESGTRVETLVLNMLIVSAASLLFPAFTTNHTLRLVSFFVFEVCVGMFWPSLGYLRGRYVPEEVRATVMNLFRVPLNMIVVMVLANIDSLSESEVFGLCFVCLIPALLSHWRLCHLVLTSPEAIKKGDLAHSSASPSRSPNSVLAPLLSPSNGVGNGSSSSSSSINGGNSTVPLLHDNDLANGSRSSPA